MNVSVTISTSTKQRLSKAPSVVSLITADDIKATGATNLTEALKGVPGVYSRANLFGFRPLIYMRGANSTGTLLMVNGSPVKEFVSSSGQYWKGLPASIIDRIEIIRGPGSALFGSDASAGVINVITKTAGRIDKSEAGVRVGGFDSQTTWLQHGTNWNGFDIAFTAELAHTDGHRPYIQQAMGNTQGYADYGYGNADIRFSMAQGNWRLLADHTQKNNLGVGLTGGAYLDPLTRGSDSQTNLALLYKNESFARDWRLDAELRYRDSKFSSGDGYFEKPPGTTNFAAGQINRQRGAEQRLNFEASGLYTGLSNHAIRVGGGYVWQDQYRVEQFVNYLNPNTGATLTAAEPMLDIADSAYAFLPKKSRGNAYLFLQDVWNFANDWELTIGGRQDSYSDFGNTFNPRAALVWLTTDRLTSKLLYGEAFIAPSFLQLYSLTSTSQGNTALRPEHSKTWDLAFSYLASRDLRLGLDYYRFIQSDIIALDSASPQKYQNSGELTASGIELEAQWQAMETLRLSAALSSRKENLLDVRSFNVPKQQANLRADWMFLPKWHWNLQVNWISKHNFSSRDTTSQPIGAYTLADTTLRYVHDKQWEFAASIRNLFDKDAREYVPTTSTKLPYGLPLPRRNLFAELRYKF
jgi:iron complex outermembrane receptor protein